MGAGRAGGSFASALDRVGWSVDLVGRESTSVLAAASLTDGVELVLLCVPDAEVAEVASRIVADDSVVIAHCAGSLGLEVLEPAPRRASAHPLVSLADADRGAAALHGAWFAVAGDPIAGRIVEALDGHSVEVDDRDRVRYHAAAVVASNHLVALMGQVERIAAGLGLPLEAYLALVRGTIDNVAAMGPQAALTGPIARSDWATVRRHLDALAPEERAAYAAMAESAAQLIGTTIPAVEPVLEPPHRGPDATEI